MKRTISIFTIFILTVLFSSFALASAGIVWNTESRMVQENELSCISYGVYNPWDDDVTVKLTVSEELKPVISKEVSEERFVKAHTASTEAEQVDFCFKVGKTYEKDCLFPYIGCKQTCEQPKVEYIGKVNVLEVKPGDSEKTGSSTSLSVSVPLKVQVACKEHGRDFTLVYIVVAIIILIILALIFLRRYRLNSGNDYQS